MILPTDDIEFRELDLAKKEKPKVAYIYYLYYNELLVYIGQAKDVNNRVPNHTDKKFNKCKYFEVSWDEKDTTEITHIKHYNPFYNGSHAIEEKQEKFIEVSDGYFFAKGFYTKEQVYIIKDEYVVCKPDHAGYYILYYRLRNYWYRTRVISGEGKLYWDEEEMEYARKRVPIGQMPDCYILPVGKYKGKRVDQIQDAGYIKWYTETVFIKRKPVVQNKPHYYKYSK